MASTDAIINVIVSGQQRVEQLISRTNELNDIITNIRRSPLDLTLGSGSQSQRDIDRLTSRLNGTRNAISRTGNDIREADNRLGRFAAAARRARSQLESLSLGTIEYGRAARRLRRAEGAFEAQRAAIENLDASLANLQRREAREFRQVRRAEAFRAQIQFANQLADTYLDVGTAARRLAGEIGSVTRSRSSAVLRSEIQFFDTLAANVDFASQAYRRFTAASGSASIAAGEASRRRFRILAETFDPEVRATTAQGRIPSTRSRTVDSQAAAEIQRLINAFPEVARSKAGLEDYRAQLQNVLDLLPAGTSRFIQLSNAIRTVDQELSRFGDAGRQLGPNQFIDVAPSGPVSDRLNSLKKQRKYAEDVNKEYTKQTDLAEEISRAAIGVTDREALSLRLNRALDALGENRLEDAQAITREVQKQLKLQKELLSSKPTRVFGVAGQDFMPISGALAAPAGVRNLAALGSPAARRLEQEAIAAWVQRGGPALPEPPKGALRTPIKGSADIPGSPKYEQEANKQKEKALDLTSRIDGIQKRILLSTASERAQQELLNDVYAARNALLEGNFNEAKRITGQIDRNRFAYERQNKALDDEKSRRQRLQNQFRKLETLQNNYLLLEQKGVRFQEEKIQLQDVLAKAVRNPEKVTKDYVNSLDQAITKFRLLAGQRVSEAKLAGAYGGPTALRQQSAATVETSRKNILGQALGVEKQLLQLESKGYSVATQKLEVQDAIARLKQLEGKSTTAANDALRAQVSTLRLLAKEEGNRAFVADEQTKKINEANRAEKKLSEAIGIAGGAAQRLVGLENTQNLVAAVNDYVGGLRDVESAAGRVLDTDKKAEQSFDARLKAAGKFKDQLLSIQKLQSDYSIAEKAGAQFLQEKLDLQELANAAAGGQIEASAENVRLLDSQIGRFKKLLALRVSEAKSTGAYTQPTRPQTAEKIESTRRRLLDQALGVQRQFITLEKNGRDVAQDRADIDSYILNLKNKQNSSTQAENELLAQQIGLLRTAAKEEANRLAALPKTSSGKKTGPEGTGLEQALKRLEEARGARQKFLGDVSPAEAIDKIVREFNKSASGGGAGANVVNTLLSEATAGVPKAAAAGEQLGQAVENGLNDGLGIQSPSKVATEAMLNVIQTLVNTARSGKAKVQAALEDLVAPKLGKVENPRDILPTSLSRAIPSIRPPYQLELDPAYLANLLGRPLTPGRPSPAGIFPAAAARVGAPGSAFPFQTYNMRTQFPVETAPAQIKPPSSLKNQASDANRILSASIKDYRAAVDNFWEGEDSQFEAIKKVVVSSGRLAAAQLARRLQQVKDLTPDQQFQRVAGEARSLLSAGQQSGLSRFAGAAKDLITGERRLGVSEAVGNTVQRISDSVLNSIEALGFSVSNSFEDGIDRIRSGIPSAVSRGLSAISGGFGGGGFGGGAGRGGGAAGGGRGGSAAQVAQLLGLDALADVSRVSTRELEALSGIVSEFRAVLDPTIEGFDRLDNQLRETIAGIGRQLERRAPDAGFLTRRLGPRTARGLSEGLIGGAFPLLFGQGIGAAVGGAAGGFGGGFAGGGLGFGLSLAGTALGTAFDGAIQSAKDLGAALRNPVENFQLLKERALLSSKAIESQAEALIESGRAAQASKLIQEDLNKRLGTATAESLKELSSASEELARATSASTAQLQAFIANMVGLGPVLRGLAAGARINELQVRAGNTISELRQQGKGAAASQLEEVFGRTRFTDITPEKYALQLSTAIEEAEKQLKPIEIKIDPKDAQKELDASIANAEKIRALRQDGTALERNAQDLRLSIEDTVYGLRKRAADMEREAVEFRRSVEDQVFSKRQELEQKLIENDRKRQQNAIDAFDLQLQRASTGLDPIAQGIVDAARQYLRVRAEGEADLQQNERQLKLQLQQIDQEVARYKLQVEDRISQMSIQRDEFTRDVAKTKLQLERQIGDYVIQVEEYRLKMAKHRYELEIDLEKKKQIAAQGGLMGGGGPVDRLMGAAAQREKFVQDQLVRRGFTPEQMAAVMGSVRQESGFNPYAQEQGGTGLGLFQWSFDRRSKVPAFTGNWQKDIQNQLDLFQRELNTTEKKAGEILMGATTLQGAAAGMKQFERYGVAGRRYDYMKDYYTRFTGGAGVPVSQQMEPGFTETFDLGAPAPTAPTAPTMPELPGAPQLVEVNDLLAQYVDLQAKLKKALEDNNSAEARRVQLQIESARLAFEQQTLSPIRQFQEQNRELQFEIEKRQLRNRLLIEGVKPEIAEGELRVLEINRALNSVLEGLEITTNEQVKAELERIGVSSDLVDSTFRLTEATLASLVATTQDVKKQEELRKKLQDILDLRDKLAGKAKNEAGGAAAGARGIAAQQASDFQKAQDAMAEMKSDLDQLIDKVNQAKSASETFGNAFASAITGSISAISGFDVMQERMTLEDEVGQLKGLRDKAKKDLARQREIGKDPNIDNSEAIRQASKNYSEYKKRIEEARSEMDKLGDTGRRVQDVLANMLKGIGDAFLEMAERIIAQQIKMLIFGTILKALGISGGVSGGAGGAGASDLPTAITSISPVAANGAYFANGIAAFAKGGMFTNSVVSSPTLFQFADGGVTRTGLMGEAGPEAIMPLKRGADGKLGVEASGSIPADKMHSAMQRYSAGARGAGVIPQYDDSRSTGADTGSMNTFTLETVVINNIEYATVDQVRAMGQQAAKQGATQGHTRSMRTLQNSRSQRSKLGMR